MKSLRSSNVKYTLHILLFVSLLSVLLFGCKKKQVSKVVVPGVEVIKTQNQNVYEYATAIGQVVSSDHVYLYARVEGFLEKKNFEDGAFVRKGEVLFQIERAQYKAQVEAAEAALKKADANFVNSKIEYSRYKTLAKTSAVSQEKYNVVDSQYGQAIANVLAAKANLALEELLLSYTLVKAPFSGRVGIAPYFVGNLVGPSSKPLIYLTKLDPIWVEFVVPETSLVTYIQKIIKENKKIATDTKLLVTTTLTPSLILSNGTKYENNGTVNFLDNRIDPTTGTFLMRASFPNPKELLLPGAYVTVKLQSNQKSQSILIPQSTLQEDQLGKYVLIVNKDNRVESRNIVTGEVYGEDILVKKGLKSGDLIIVQGIQKVRPGIKVKPVLTQMESTDF